MKVVADIVQNGDGHHVLRGVEVPMLANLGNTSISWLNTSASWPAGNGSMVTEMAAKHPVDLIPVWEIKQAIADAVEEGIRNAEQEAADNKSTVSIEAIKEAVNARVFEGWEDMKSTMKANRFKRRTWTGTQQQQGFIHFFKSVEVLDWVILLIFIIVFLAQHYHVLYFPSNRTFHGMALLLWVLMAGLYNFLVFQRMGTTGGILWLNGYILEMVFLVENVLVCHIIVAAFRSPRWVNEKALFIVVCCRLLFQMGFYMGLAELVFSGQALPYILGLWLLYVAYQSAILDDDTSFDIMDTRVVHLARAVFGDRLSLTRDDSGAMFVHKDGKLRLSLVGLMVFCLVLVDFLLHVDVALTKIEELGGNAFICFSSAAMAAFALPELIFVTRDMFKRFPGLKYGISLVLVYIAVQMLLHQVWWPPISMDLIIWVTLLVLSAAMPAASAGWRRATKGVDAGSQASFFAADASKPKLAVGDQGQ